MTKKKFIIAGLSLIGFSALLIATATYLLLSGSAAAQENIAYFSFFPVLITPLLFSFLLWKRLKTVGRSLMFIVASVLSFLTLHWFGSILSSLFIVDMMMTLFNPTEQMTDELATWAKTNSEGEFSLSFSAKLKMTLFNGTSTFIAHWPMALALLWGAAEPRTPSRPEPVLAPA